MVNFILFLIVLGVILLLIWKFAVKITVKEKRGGEVFTTSKVSWLKALPIIIVGLLVLLVLPASIKVVPVGHCLVVFNIMTKNYSIAREGINFIFPFVNQTIQYDLRRQEYTMAKQRGEGRRANVDDALWSPTKEGLQIGLDLTCWHRIDPLRVAEIHRKIGPLYEEKVIRPSIRSVVRLVVSEYRVMDVYSAQRKAIEQAINDRLKTLLAKDGFIIDDVILRDVTFTKEFERAIEEKQVAEQTAKKMEYVLDKEKKEAERRVIEAKGKANAIEIVNRVLRKSPDYINYLYVDKLADDVKVIVSDQRTIMDLKGMLGK